MLRPALISLITLFLLAACTQGDPGPAATSTPLPTTAPGVEGVLGAKSYPGPHGQIAPIQASAALPTPTVTPLVQTPTLPEAVVREAIRRMAQAGPGEVVPGFGGLSLGHNDNSIVYVYMLDPSQQGAAEEAAKIILGRQRLEREIREVQVLQDEYSWGQFLGCYREAQKAVFPQQVLDRVIEESDGAFQLVEEEDAFQLPAGFEATALVRTLRQVATQGEREKLLSNWLSLEGASTRWVIGQVDGNTIIVVLEAVDWSQGREVESLLSRIRVLAPRRAAFGPLPCRALIL